MGACSSSNKKQHVGQQRLDNNLEEKKVKLVLETKKASIPLEAKKPETHSHYNSHHPQTHQPGVGDGSSFPAKIDKSNPHTHHHHNHRDSAAQNRPVESKLFLQKEHDGLVHKVPLLEEGLKDSSIVRRRLSSTSPNQSAGTIAEASPERA